MNSHISGFVDTQSFDTNSHILFFLACFHFTIVLLNVKPNLLFKKHFQLEPNFLCVFFSLENSVIYEKKELRRNKIEWLTRKQKTTNEHKKKDTTHSYSQIVCDVSCWLSTRTVNRKVYSKKHSIWSVQHTMNNKSETKFTTVLYQLENGASWRKRENERERGREKEKGLNVGQNDIAINNIRAIVRTALKNTPDNIHCTIALYH